MNEKTLNTRRNSEGNLMKVDVTIVTSYLNTNF